MIRACHKVFFGQASVLVQDMEKKKKEKRGALAGCARVCKIFGTVCLVAVILVCLPLTLPRVFGYEIYTVISGSMEPAIPVGSLVYVQPGAPEDAETDDVIAFHSSMDTGAIITHRVIKNDIVTGQIHTKGDANEKEDLYPVGYDYYMGKVVYSVPVLGRVLAFFVIFHGKIAAGSLIGLAILLQIIGGILESANEKKQAKISQK